MPGKPPIDIDKSLGSLCKKKFYRFVQEFWDVIIPEEPVWNWHIEYLCSELQELVMRVIRREAKLEDVIINIPPGTSKTTIVTVMLPAWAWAVDPTLRILSTSYSDEVAMVSAVKSRNVILSDKYRRLYPQVEIKKDQNSKSNYETTKNGQRYATGVRGSITSMHFHLILNDDPINPKEAASEVECAGTNAVIDSTLATRKVDKKVTLTILIMQRLSENDPTGHLLSKMGKKVRHICLPAELRDGVKPRSLEQYYVDGLLDPIRLDRQVLDDALADLGAANFAGQFGQRPAPAGGLIWKRWFMEVPDEKWPDRKYFTSYGTDWDTAYTKDDENAASAWVTSGKIGHNIYLDDYGWAWVEYPELIKLMKTKPAPHYIEAKASGKSSKQSLTRSGIPAIEIQVAGGDKIARANLATPVAEAGMVYIRKSQAERIYTDAKQGILVFPRGKFKDLADVLAQALQRQGKRGSVSGTTGSKDGEEEE